MDEPGASGGLAVVTVEAAGSAWILAVAAVAWLGCERGLAVVAVVALVALPCESELAQGIGERLF